jgi:exodeoxyribonuclease V gamma subunit
MSAAERAAIPLLLAQVRPMHTPLPTLHRSNQVEELGRAFIDLLRREPLGDPFQAETVLVGSTGLRDWLRRRVAHELGVAAQLRFVYPGTLGSWLHEAHRHRTAGGAAARSGRPAADTEEETPWVPDRLVWVVATELVAVRALPPQDSDPLSVYLHKIDTRDETDGAISLSIFALAFEISRLFLRYHAWRPGMIASWAEAVDRYAQRDGTLAPFQGAAAELAWQPVLWRRVRDRLRAAGATDPLAELGALRPADLSMRGSDHLTLAHLAPDDSLRDALAAVLPPRITLFGVASLAPLQLMELGRIAQVVPVHWFLTAPTPYWLGDQTLTAVAHQDHRRRAWIEATGAGRQREIYLDEPARRALQSGPTPSDVAEPLNGSEPRDTELGEQRGFDDLEGTVCPLVAAFGRVPRASQLLVEHVLADAPEGDTAFVHPLVTEAERRREHAPQSVDHPPTALHRLQADVYMLESAAYHMGGAAGSPFRHDIDGGEALLSLRGERSVRADDRSLGFHACYGPSRQVDAVRDLIVDALARDPSLRPGDIAVMTPNIADMAPLIEATFLPHAPRSNSLERTGIPGLPIRIQDRAIRSTNPVANVLLALLALGESRRTLTAVLGLLALEPVYTHFDLDRTDVSRVGEWLREAGARWGLDASDVPHGTDASAAPGGHDSRLRHTLVAALERLALGAVLPLDAIPGDDGARLAGVARDGALPVFPLDKAGDRSLAARATLFLETLLFALDTLRASRPLDEWLRVLVHEDADAPGLVQRFVTLPASRAWQKAQVVDELEALVRDTAALLRTDGLGGSMWVTPAAIASWMQTRMDRADKSVSDGLDAVTFCSLMPVRSVPYRWVILLGVDSEVFPRTGTRPAWDLIAREPRAWDRNPRDEDRALFLDALLSARDAFHIFYTGRTPQRNEEVAPAAPIAQLLEMLDRRFVAPTPPHGDPPTASAWFTRSYPLQPFSERNFRASPDEERGQHAPRPPVYHAGERRAAESLLTGRGNAGAWSIEVPWHATPELPHAFQTKQTIELSIDDLVSFFECPLTDWFQRFAGIRWRRNDEGAPDDLLPSGSSVLDRMEVLQQADAHKLAWDDDLLAAYPRLPVGPEGRSQGRDLTARVHALHHTLFGNGSGPPRLTPPHTHRLSLSLPIDLPDAPWWPDRPPHVHVRLVGEAAISRIGDGGQAITFATQYSSIRSKHATRAWLQLLLATAVDAGAFPASGRPRAALIGVAPHKTTDSISAHGLTLTQLHAPQDEGEARAWARERLIERVRTWLVGQCRPMPVLPNGSSDVVEDGYKAHKKSGALVDWMQCFVERPAVIAPLPQAHVSRSDGSHPVVDAWAAEWTALESGSDAMRKALRAMRTKAHTTWNTEGFMQKGDEYRTDPMQPLLLRIFGAEGPAQRWPQAFVVDSWRVFGPGFALASEMKKSEPSNLLSCLDLTSGGTP